MEFRPGKKHMLIATGAGIALSLGMLYLGMIGGEERWLYAGMFNSHEKEAQRIVIQRLNQDLSWRAKYPDAHLKEIDYSVTCVECHTSESAWKVPDNDICMQCHSSIKQPTPGAAPAFGYQPVSAAYHKRVANLSCSACHKIHYFNAAEPSWYGYGFYHAELIPDWDSRYDCYECHEAFDSVEEVTKVLRTARGYAYASYGQGDVGEQLRQATRKYLTPELQFRLDREASGLVDLGGRTTMEIFEPTLEEISKLPAEVPVILYFRDEASMNPGGVGDYLENYLFRTEMFNAARGAAPVAAIDHEKAPAVWLRYGVKEAGALLVLQPDGTSSLLPRFYDPAHVVQFLREELAPGADHAAESAEPANETPAPPQASAAIDPAALIASEAAPAP